MLEELIKPEKRQRVASALSGFTLIELMIALTVLTILITLAVPSFRNTLLNSRRAAAVNEIVTSLQLARIEALKQARDAYVCPSTSGGTSCSTTAADWTNGWMVWVDLDRDETFDSPAELLRYQDNESRGVSILIDSSTPNARVRFRPFQVGMAGTSIAVCDERGSEDSSQHRTVVIANTGRPRIALGDTTGECP